MSGESPNVNHGIQTDTKRLFYSDPLTAIRPPATVQAGYGTLSIGLTMAQNGSAAGNINKIVPYDPTAVTGAEVAPGRAYLVSDSGASATVLYVTLGDSYKFVVGDDVYINDDTTTLEQLGAITAIDRTTYTHMATITVTTATGSTSFTTARYAYLAVKGSDTAVGILDASRNTGTGSSAADALGSIVVKNALLYTGMITNLDAAAKTDLSTSVFGQYTII